PASRRRPQGAEGRCSQTADLFGIVLPLWFAFGARFFRMGYYASASYFRDWSSVQLDSGAIWLKTPGMPGSTARIAIVHDDGAVRKGLARLLRASSFEAGTFDSAMAFLDSLRLRTPDCLILDLQMPEMTGLQLQHQLARSKVEIPTIIITAHDEMGA